MLLNSALPQEKISLGLGSGRADWRADLGGEKGWEVEVSEHDKQNRHKID